MKAFITTALLIIIIGNIGAADIESYQFIDYLRSISAPGRPEIYNGGVVFTATSSYNRIGISFAHEGYAKVHWLKHLMIPRDSTELMVNGKIDKKMSPNKDSGIMFHYEMIPENLKNMDYRMIFDGLWTTDPQNPVLVRGPSGISESRISLPLHSAAQTPGSEGSHPARPAQNGASAGTYRFIYQGPPGETVTVGGTFNNWDPFLYELRETNPGYYSLNLPLPPGSFQYVFYRRGEAIPDPSNPITRFSREGMMVSEAEMP